MLDCWNESPADRRTFQELRSLFDAMLAEDNPYIQFENINMHKSYYNTGSRRNTACEEELVANFSSSEIDFEASSTSTVTLNGASIKGGAYDNLTPLVPPESPPCDLEDDEDEQNYSLHTKNQYVDTPTFKNQEDSGVEDDTLSGYHVKVSGLPKQEVEGSTEAESEMASPANSAPAVE